MSATLLHGEKAADNQDAALPEHTELIGYSAAALSLVALLLGVWLSRRRAASAWTRR